MAERWSYTSMNGETVTRRGTPARISSATSTMDEKYRESLQRHYRLLMTHLILTDDVIQQMSKEKILPETMIKDIQNGETREVRNERLLNALRLRGNKSYKRFRELMYRTGNFFVADLLWEDGDEQGLMEETDLARFPGLVNCVQDGQKKKLLHYLDAKIREKALLLAWKDSPQQRIELLNNKVIDFKQEKILRDTITSQENKIKTLEFALKTEEEKTASLKMEMSTLQQQISLLKREHRNSMDTQTRFHDANMSTIGRLKERLMRAKAELRDLNSVVKLRLDIGADDSDSDDFDNNDEEVRVSVLERNVRSVMHQLKHEQDQARSAQSQREDVLKLLNRRYSREPLVNVVRDVLKHEQKHRSLVMRDILRLSDTLKQALPGSNPQGAAPELTAAAYGPMDPALLDTKHFKSQLAMLRAEAEHIQKKFAWKDSEIGTLRQEVLSLKQRLGDLAFHSSPPAPSPSSTSALSTPQVSPYQPPNTPSAPMTTAASSDTQLTLPARATAHCRHADDKKHGHSADNLAKVGVNKSVTFKDAVQLSQEGGGPDLDKTQVNIDHYLVDDDDLEDGEEGGGRREAVLRGEGDTRPGLKNSAFYAAHARVNQR